MDDENKFIVTVKDSEDILRFDEIEDDDENVLRARVNDIREEEKYLRGIYLIRSRFDRESLANIFNDPAKRWKIDRYEDGLYTPLFITHDEKGNSWKYKYHVAVQMAEKLADNYDYSNYIDSPEGLEQLCTDTVAIPPREKKSESWIINLNQVISRVSAIYKTMYKLDRIIRESRKEKNMLIFLVKKEHPSHGTLNMPSQLKDYVRNLIIVHGCLPTMDKIYCTDFMINFRDLRYIESLSEEIYPYFFNIRLTAGLDLVDDVRTLLTVNPSMFEKLSQEKFERFGKESGRFDTDVE